MKKSLLTIFFLTTSLIIAENTPAASKGAKLDDAGHLRIPLQITKDIKAVYQISHDAIHDGSSRALVYAKKLIDTYNKHGIPDEEIDLHLVFHGASIKALIHDAHRERLEAAGGIENTNKQLLAELVQRGVCIELCESTMQQHDVTSKDLLDGVSTVPGAFPRLIELQRLGYPYIKFE